ncbi:MAG: DnaD domain protein [Oscillospiraceae bacterium]|nr:DnaD domain protein [Oscillospiraceae bacterium]MBR4636267.1 DnaD domain protein [Clostridia bacterium]MBR6839119.1 DnaD domain protein [Oscillospiraceae bacterium]
MSRVNYVREMKGFAAWAEANGLSGSERLLWQALFHLFNARAYGDDWPEGYVEIGNKEISGACGLSQVTVWRTRTKLAERGIIDFIPGDGSVKTSYKMRYISVEGAPAAKAGRETVAAGCRRYGESDVSVSDGLFTVNRGAIHSEKGAIHGEKGAIHDEKGAIHDEKGPVEYKEESIDINDINFLSKQEEDDIYNNNINGRARDTRESMYEEVIGDSYRTKVGRSPTPQEVQSITEIAEWNRADASLVREAIERGASANYPSKYAVTCLMSWGDTGLRTLEELETYERFREMASMTRPDIAAKGAEKLRAYLREIEIKHRMVAV